MLYNKRKSRWFKGYLMWEHSGAMKNPGSFCLSGLPSWMCWCGPLASPPCCLKMAAEVLWSWAERTMSSGRRASHSARPFKGKRTFPIPPTSRPLLVLLARTGSHSITNPVATKVNGITTIGLDCVIKILTWAKKGVALCQSYIQGVL